MLFRSLRPIEAARAFDTASFPEQFKWCGVSILPGHCEFGVWISSTRCRTCRSLRIEDPAVVMRSREPWEALSGAPGGADTVESWLLLLSCCHGPGTVPLEKALHELPTALEAAAPEHGSQALATWCATASMSIQLRGYRAELNFHHTTGCGRRRQGGANRCERKGGFQDL